MSAVQEIVTPPSKQARLAQAGLCNFKNFHELTHPLIQHKLSLMRDKNRSTNAFRQLLREISLLAGYELTRNLPLGLTEIETPLETTQVPRLSGKKLAIIPVLRAGLGMADGLLDLVPSARVGHIGLYRDPHTHQPVEYLVKLPPAPGRIFLVVDPMLATGNSAVHALDVVLRHGVAMADMRFLCLVAAPEGVKRLAEAYPQVAIYCCALDTQLDEHDYILPGLGDAGDRLFGTL
jgi:uracil phosphoribosyltransferase